MPDPNNDAARRCLILGLCDPPMTQQSALAQLIMDSPDRSEMGIAGHLLRNFQFTHRPEEADLFGATLAARDLVIPPGAQPLNAGGMAQIAHFGGPEDIRNQPQVTHFDFGAKPEPTDPTLVFDPDKPKE